MKYNYEPLRDPKNKFSIALEKLQTKILHYSLKVDCEFDLTKLTLRNDFFDWFEEDRAELEMILINEMQKQTEKKTYFFGCSFEIYKLNYNVRLRSYLETYFDADEEDFIRVELKKNYDYYYNLKVNRHDLNQTFDYSILSQYTLGEQILFSLKARNKFLNEKLSVNSAFEPIEPEALDLSNLTGVEKMIYLQRLGIIDFLRNEQPFSYSTNKLATVLSAITGEKNIQPMLNPILNKEVVQKNNPLNSVKTVSKVENQLIKLGFNLNDTI